MDENNQNLKALQADNSRTEEEEDGEEFEEDDDDKRQLNELESSRTPIGEDSRNSQYETLAPPSTCSVSEVPVDYAMQRHELTDLKNKVQGSHQEALASVIAQAAQAHFRSQLQLSGVPSSSEELSASVTQPISSIPSSNLHEQRLSPVTTTNNICMALAEVDQRNASDSKAVSTSSNVKTPSTDGFNWRKYGQKQVKSPQGSRSYYKCTHTKCYAKKIESCDHSNCVTDIVYKGRHNHDPLRKVHCTRESKLSLFMAPVVRGNNSGHPNPMVDNTDLSTSSKVPIQETTTMPELKRQNSSGSDETALIQVKEDVHEPDLKRRVKKSRSACSGSLLKTSKNPKFVVHTAGDVGISGDGYRWRKYGQKMVKGTPHPRNYYRCTSAGCPVRKHMERAVDTTEGVIITYRGVHDHDMPVPKKRQAPQSGLLVAAAAPASMNNSQSKPTEALPLLNQVPKTQWSVGTEGGLTGEALNLGGEKAIESARTLLSIGFEIKPC